ncbi:hypothetical protein J7K27_05665 [Candidatus Bathyarchaeota archaeon]|nr:hypothetical protein [Candidatus Bathyarchaeota archaeon]
MAQPQPKLDNQTAQDRNRHVHLKPLAPLRLWRQLYCQNCPDREFCRVNFEHHLLCILSKLAHEVAWQNRLTEKLNSHKL